MRDGKRGGSTRTPTADASRPTEPEHGQLALFTNEHRDQAPHTEQRDRSPLAAHWPDLVAGSCQPVAAAPLVLWAETFPHLRKRTRAVLVALAREAGEKRTCQICLRHLAPALGIGRNTVKRHLEKLLAAGLVMMREQRALGARSYDYHLIVDLEDRASAIADGFVAYRPVGRL